MSGACQSDQPRLLIATRILGSSGQPWLWRQVVGLRGFRKEVVCWEQRNPTTQPLQNIAVHVLTEDPAPYDGDAGRWWYRLRNLPERNFYAAVGRQRRRLTELFRRGHSFVLLCYFGDVAMRLLPTARRLGVPVVAYFHGDFQFVFNRWYRWSVKRCLRKFAAVVVVTEAERNWMIDQGLDGDDVVIIPCGAPIDIFLPAARKPAGDARFVMVSRLSDDKGCDLSIRAFARVASRVSRAELHVYGDGPARQVLRDLVAALSLKARVFFHGYVGEKELAQVLPSFDVFIQHSLRKEGSPVSIAEAMACGLPVVATRVGGIIEQVIEGKTGLLIAERDVNGMAAAMRRLVCDSALRQSLGRAGRERAINLYDSSRQTQRLEHVLLSVAGRGLVEASARAESARG